MTTHYVTQLGVAKCREILKGAPTIGRFWPEFGLDTNKYYCYDDFDGSWYEYWDIPNAPMWQKVYSKEDFSFKRVPLKDLRAELSLHDTDSCIDIRNHVSPNTVVVG